MRTTTTLQKAFDERKSKPEGDESELPSFDVGRHHESMRLLAIIDELDRLIADNTTDETSKKKLRRTRSVTAHKFAEHLDADTSKFAHAYIVADDHRHVWAVLEIMGTPSRAGRLQADEWSAARGLPWNGDIRKLRALIRRALGNGEQLPAGRFGLRFEKTIRIGEWSNKDAKEWESIQPPLPLGPDDIRF